MGIGMGLRLLDNRDRYRMGIGIGIGRHWNRDRKDTGQRCSVPEWLPCQNGSAGAAT